MSIVTDGAIIKDPPATTIQNVTQEIVNNITTPTVEHYYTVESPNNGDPAGQVIFSAKDSAKQKTAYATLKGMIVDKTNGSEDGAFDMTIMVAGVETRVARFDQNFARKSVCIEVKQSDQDTAVADGKDGFAVPAALNGWNLVAATASVHTAGTTNTTDIMIRRRRESTDADMLSTPITINSGAYTASDGVIDTAKDDLATGDLIFIDIDAVSTTAAKGLSVTLEFQYPAS
jgi:hypothetical protein